MRAATYPTSAAGARTGRPTDVPPFDFAPLNRVVFGPGSLARLGELARHLGGTRVLLVTDPGLEEAGHPQRAAGFLREAGLEVSVFDEVRENPTSVQVEVGAAFARDR